MARNRFDQRGQVMPVLAVVLVLALVGAVVVARVGVAVHDRALARTAADAAALAGAAGDRAAADALARANHGDLERFVRAGVEVEVTVRVGAERATARARRDMAP